MLVNLGCRRYFRRWADPLIAEKVSLLRATLSTDSRNRNGNNKNKDKDSEGLTMPEAIQALKEYATTNDRTECRFSLNLMCRLVKSTMNGFRGFLELPHPVPKAEERLLVFCPPNMIDRMKERGASFAGGAELIEPIVNGEIVKFTRCLGHPDLIPVITKLARILGPLGLMPNVKHGTLTKDLEVALDKCFRTSAYHVAKQTGVLNMCIGKTNFTDSQLTDNLKRVLMTVQDLGTDSIKKRSFITQATLSASGMSGSIRLHRMAYEKSSIKVIPPSVPTAPPQVLSVS